MSSENSVEKLLRWRLARAEAEAPPAPGAARLLERARPWWEALPERFQALLGRLGALRIAYGHAMADPGQARLAHAVPALIVRGEEERESAVHPLYLSVRDGRLRLRFQLDPVPGPAEPSFEATLILDQDSEPLCCAPAILAVESEYRLDAELPEEVARQWEQLKVTDRLPFRLILRAGIQGD